MKLVNKAEAHVLYIADEGDVNEFGGTNGAALSEPFTHASNIVVMFYGIFLVALIVLLFKKTHSLRVKTQKIFLTALSYADLVPWILRLSLGIALIGAGINGWLISPTLTGFDIFSSAQITFGFLLLSGFLTTFAVLGANLMFLLALSQNFYLLGSAEFFAMSLSLLALDGRRPGVDHLLAIPTLHFKEFKKWIPVILRIGIGTSFVFLAVYEKFLNPDLAIHVAEIANLSSVINVSPAMWVVSSGIIEFLLGAMFLFGFAVRACSAVATIILALSFFYFGEDVTSHITLFGALSALFILGGKKLRF